MRGKRYYGGAVFVSAFMWFGSVLAGGANAGDNPFSIQQISPELSMTAAGDRLPGGEKKCEGYRNPTIGGTTKCGEGKCGGDKPKPGKKCGSNKCQAGKSPVRKCQAGKCKGAGD
ncbi:MAG: hypothetical protein KDJ33_06175 [Gammaproteobacteria bacterium]|nr:hypothetical protein [Gammaproteobacteria bacterium]